MSDHTNFFFQIFSYNAIKVFRAEQVHVLFHSLSNVLPLHLASGWELLQ